MNKIDFFGQSSRTPSERRELLESRSKLKEQNKSFSKAHLDYDYFDNPDNPTGYRGYKYDGRFQESASKIANHYGLKKGSSVFELGAAKGFVLAEFAKLGCRVFGQDMSIYAVKNCHELLVGKILLEQAPHFPWKDGEFDLVIAKDVLPHLPYELIDETIRQLVRISKKNLFFDIECGRNDWEKWALKEWDETHLICETPEWWEEKLVKNGFHGDVHFKVLLSADGLPDLL